MDKMEIIKLTENESDNENCSDIKEYSKLLEKLESQIKYKFNNKGQLLHKTTSKLQ